MTMPSHRASILLRCFALLAVVVGAWAAKGVVTRLAADDPQAAGAQAAASAPAVKPASPAAQPAAPVEDDELDKLLADTIDQVERNYVKQIDRRTLIEAAVEGMVRKLDPYSAYISPQEIDRFRSNLDNEFGGIGIQVSSENGVVEVISPMAGTPAYRAGIQSGDRITHIAGKPIVDVAGDEVIKRLQGPVGSLAVFSIMRPSFAEPRQIAVTREVIHVETVVGDRRRDDETWNFYYDEARQIGYIRLSAFSRDTAAELQQALADLQRAGLKSLILDLRFNPGGLLSSAIEVSDLFLRDGVIVSTEGRNVPRQSWSARDEGTFGDVPMVVLVNRYSASASEIVSAALQDNHRATIVGERTWGKGSVQNVIELEGGRSALKLTTAVYRRPNGHNIHRFPDAKETDEWGVTPDDGFLIKLPDAELAALAADRRQRDVVRPHAARTNALRAPEPDEGAELAVRDANSEAKPNEDAGATKPSSPAASNPSAESPSPATSPNSTSSATGPFTDRQLQRAVELLTSKPSLPRRP
jgi:carboxyl-terminal processing protease